MTIETDYRAAIVEQASELIGRPSIKYVRDHPELGLSPVDGFDCSGFVRFVLSQAGLHIPDYIGQDDIVRPVRHTNEFWGFYGYLIDDSLVEPGDLYFSSNNGRSASHMGIVRDPESFIQAPGKPNTKVKLSPIVSKPVKYDGQGKQLYVINPIGFKAPAVVLDKPTDRYNRQVI